MTFVAFPRRLIFENVTMLENNLNIMIIDIVVIPLVMIAYRCKDHIWSMVICK